MSAIEWWRKCHRGDDPIWVALAGDSTSDLAVFPGGLIPYRYKGVAYERIYRTKRNRIVLGDPEDVARLPEAIWPDDMPQQQAPPPPPRSRARSTDADLQRKLDQALARCAVLEQLVRAARREAKGAKGAPAALPVELDDLIALCHPDRHPAGRQEIANRVTAKLLDLRRSR